MSALGSIWVEKLRGDKAFPVDAIALAVELEDAGWDLLKEEDRLILRPKTQNATKTHASARALDDAIKVRIQALKPYLISIVDYLATLDVVVAGLKT